MDRFDEKKHDRIDDDTGDERRDDIPAREGDVLGLGGTVVPKTPGDPSASHDAESAARQRARMREDEAASVPDRGSEDSFGATSIDLGVAEGNTINRKR